MTRYLLLFAVIFVAFAGWSIGEKLSADALGMAVGLVFGVMASIPAALLVLAAARRAPRSTDRAASSHRQPSQTQAPVIVVAAPPVAGYGQHQQFFGGQQALPPSHQIIDAQPQRQFHVIGEEDEFVDEF